ncbi:MAG: SCO family protein [Rhizobiaceae bacterium]|nr:SCO family protein [Rhizobiaceae bacterium]
MRNPDMMRFVLAGIIFLMAIAIGWITFDWYRIQNAEVAFGGPFELVDNRGEPITEQAFREHPSAVFFGFTHCPEVCPTTLFEMDGWLKQLGDEGKDIRAYFVTVDPERDTPQAMNDYVTNVSDRITGITGDPAKIDQVIKDFKIYARKVPTEDGDYTMDHTASVLLLGRQGQFFGTIAYEENSETAIAKLKRLAVEG